MAYLLIFIVLVFTLSLLRLKLPTVLCFVIFTFAVLNGYSFDQLSFVFLDRLQLLAQKQEMMAIPFLLFSSELLYSFGYFDDLKKILFNRLPGQFLPLITYFSLSSTAITSAVLFSSIFDIPNNKLQKESNLRVHLKIQYFLTSISLLFPISIPVFIVASLLSLSLKKIILLSLFAGLLLFLLYYVLFIRKQYLFEKVKTEVPFHRLIPVVGFGAVFYLLIFVFSYNVLITSQILFLFVLVTTFLQNRSYFSDVFFTSMSSAVTRSGIILSIIYCMYLINYFHEYTHATEAVFSFIINNFTDSSFIIVLVYIVAFFLALLLDPLGVILVLSPIYISIINTYGVDRYVFALSFIFFLSMGFSNNIVGLPGHAYRLRYRLTTVTINDMLLREQLIVVVLSFIPYVLLYFKI